MSDDSVHGGVHGADVVRITDDDLRAAKRAWLTARDAGASEARVATLRESYIWVMRGQAQQIADDFRSGRG